MNGKQGEHQVYNEGMSQSINNSSGCHQGHLAGFLLGSYSLRRTPQVLNTFFKRQLLNAEHGTL